VSATSYNTYTLKQWLTHSVDMRFAWRSAIFVTGQKVATGSPGGSPRLIREMLHVAARHKVHAITGRFAMAKAN
jgi:hypothetical protein